MIPPPSSAANQSLDPTVPIELGRLLVIWEDENDLPMTVSLHYCHEDWEQGKGVRPCLFGIVTEAEERSRSADWLAPLFRLYARLFGLSPQDARLASSRFAPLRPPLPHCGEREGFNGCSWQLSPL